MATEFSAGLPILTDKSFSDTIDESFRGPSDSLYSPINSSPPESSHNQPYSSDNVREREISMLDPRRFTPTLHASLVSEILSVRRDLDLKAQFIDSLEASLQVVKSENEALFSQLNRSSKENKMIKRQLELLERDSSAALEGLARERDSAKESDNGMKYKIEMLRRKIRAQEEDVAQWQESLEAEKCAWNLERRRLERRVHTSETRLKVVLKDVAAYRASEEADEASWALNEDEMFKDPTYGIDSERNSIRSTSRKDRSRAAREHERKQSSGSDRKSVRLSAASLSEPEGAAWLNGQSLADELSFGEVDVDSQDAIDSNDDLTEQELRARRGMNSSQSYYQDEKAKRVLGLTSSSGNHISNRMDLEDPLLEHEEFCSSDGTTKQCPVIDTESPNPNSKVMYKDVGVQFDQAPSTQPLNQAIRESNVKVKLFSEISPDNRRKHFADSPGPEGHDATNMETAAASIASSACQNIGLQISAPTTLMMKEALTSSLNPKAALQFISNSTQTEFVDDNERLGALSDATKPLPVPIITINPPLSAPSSPRDAILPPGTKNAGCQVNIDTETPVISVSVQTEEIRIDPRPLKLSKQSCSSDTTRLTNPEKIYKLQISRPSGFFGETRSTSPLGGGYFNSADNGGPSADTLTANRGCSHRITGGDNNSKLPDSKQLAESKGVPAVAEGADIPSERVEDHSEAKENFIPKNTLSKAAFTSTNPILSSTNVKSSKTVPDAQTLGTAKPVLKNITNLPLRNSQTFDQKNHVDKRLKNFDSKQKSVWRSTLIQSGTVAHRKYHSKCPSAGSGGSSTTGSQGANPPFPVPARSSSMGITHCDSDGPQTPTPRKHGSPSTQHQSGRRQASRVNNIRKVRSAAAISRDKRHNHHPHDQLPTQSPTRVLSEISQPLAAARKATTSPAIPQPIVQSSKLVYPDSTSQGSGAYIEGPTQPSVIDAIAATMVGEWMWKYVRKRKSFGIAENGQEIARARDDGSGNTTSNGTRHKRWVWLSPYDKTVMWSSKQPITEAALMGKPNRTLNIQSVLDVKDDVPVSRNGISQIIYNRSILILTPTRALKFTAFSADRHFLWLKALSFLVHSSANQPIIPPITMNSWNDSENTTHQCGTSLRRASAKDSFHISKENACTDLGASNVDSSASAYLAGDLDEHVSDAASPPNVPRFYHGRVRSNTGSRLVRPLINSRALPPIQQVTLPQPLSHLEGSITVIQKGSAINGNDVISEIDGGMPATGGSTKTHDLVETQPTYRMEAFFEPRFSGGSFQGLPGLGQLGVIDHKDGTLLDENQRGDLLENAPETSSLFRGF